jgi:hypothetical protein
MESAALMLIEFKSELRNPIVKRRACRLQQG